MSPCDIVDWHNIKDNARAKNTIPLSRIRNLKFFHQQVPQSGLSTVTKIPTIGLIWIIQQQQLSHPFFLFKYYARTFLPLNGLDNMDVNLAPALYYIIILFNAPVIHSRNKESQ